MSRTLFNHATRSWLFAEAIGRMKEMNYDREVAAIGTVLHDIGLTTSASGPKPLRGEWRRQQRRGPGKAAMPLDLLTRR